MSEVQEPVLLESYMYWRNAWEQPAPRMVKLRELFHDVFPSKPWVWHAALPECPYHAGPPILKNEHGRQVYCICEVIKLCYSMNESMREIVAPPPEANLFDIKPQVIGGGGLGEKTKTEEFQKYLANEWMWAPENFAVDGGVGSGKSTMLRALYWRHPMVTTYMPVAQLSNVFYDFKTLGPHMAQIQTYPILLLDDIGTEHNTDYFLSAMYKIVDFRYTWRHLGLVTVVATNVLNVITNENQDIAVQRLGSRFLDGRRFFLVQSDFRRLRRDEKAAAKR